MRSSRYDWPEHCPRPASGTTTHRCAKVPPPRGHENLRTRKPAHHHCSTARRAYPINGMKSKTPKKGGRKTHILTRILLTKSEMCGRDSQAPLTLVSPKLETTERKGALRLNCEYGLPSPFVQRYPEPTGERGKGLLCDSA